MKNRTLHFYLYLIISLVFLSCNRDPLLLDIKFGINKHQLEEQITSLIKDKKLNLVIKDNDTLYTLPTYNWTVGFNNDNIGSGNLREYDYDIVTNIFKLPGNYLEQTGCTKEYFNQFNKTLADKYNNGIVPNPVYKEFQSTLTYSKKFETYEYKLDKVDILLFHGEDIQNVNLPMFHFACMEIRSKTYDADYQKELDDRRRNLKPEDVIAVNFQTPSISEDNFYGINRPCIVITKEFESYKGSKFMDDDITECKGILFISNAYGDTISKSELNFSIEPPLKSNGELRPVFYKTWKMDEANASFNALVNLIHSGARINTTFKPTAVVLANGSVIR